MLIFVSQITLTLFALWLIGLSLWAMLKPKSALYGLSKMGSTNLINYTELGLRFFVGLGFIGGAGLFKLPQASMIFGWFLVITSIILMLIPRGWHSAYSVYWSEKLTPLSVRLFMPFGISFGVFLLLLIWR